MAKLSILLLAAVYGVSSMPGAPFVRYGLPDVAGNEEDISLELPGAKNLAEKSLPAKFFERPQVPNGLLPGTRNLAEKSQLPLTLPAPIENLEEKAIPVTAAPLQQLPIQSYPKFQAPPVQQPHPQPHPASAGGDQPSSKAIPVVPARTTSGPLAIPPGTTLKLEDNRGQYSHGFATPEGTEVQETGRLITTNGGWEYVIAKEGSYSYRSPEGIPISVRYVADHNGFRIID